MITSHLATSPILPNVLMQSLDGSLSQLTIHSNSPRQQRGLDAARIRDVVLVLRARLDDKLANCADGAVPAAIVVCGWGHAGKTAVHDRLCRNAAGLFMVVNVATWEDESDPVEALWHVVEAVQLQCVALAAIVLVVDGSSPRELLRLRGGLPVWKLLLPPKVWSTLALVVTHASALPQAADSYSVEAKFVFDPSNDVDCAPLVLRWLTGRVSLMLHSRCANALLDLCSFFHTAHAASLHCMCLQYHRNGSDGSLARSRELWRRIRTHQQRMHKSIDGISRLLLHDDAAS